VLVIAHRGSSGHAPENTLAAFRKAVAQGAAFIETDLQLSRDARFVAIHDATVDRTTGGHGDVHGLTLAELRQLDAGSWFGSEFAGERIPTLEEILDFAKKHDAVFYLELKPTGSWGGEHALISALRESGEIPRTVVISFDAGILDALRKIEPTLMTGLLYDGQIEKPVDRAVEIGAQQPSEPGAAGRGTKEGSASGVLDGEPARAHASADRSGGGWDHERLSRPLGGSAKDKKRGIIL